MTLYQHNEQRNHFLSQKHEEMLFKESGIARDIVRERGVRSIRRGRELPKEFSWRQRKRGRGILLTVHRLNGEMSWSFRPDEPDPDQPGRKYEQPSKHYGGPGNVLDVHPRMRHLIDDTSVEITFVEGIKKADALTSRGILAVAITGVWNWLSDGKPISDMMEIPISGRRVNILFDSDMLYNPDVQGAAKRLAEHLTERGAEVWITYLPNKPDGSKMGADDFFVSGGTVAELKMLMRRYDPPDFTIVRLSRDERLQLMLEDLSRTFWAVEWRGMGGHSARDVFKVLADEALQSGKPHADGIRITIARRRLTERAKVSSRTLYKAIARLEDAELVYRDNEGRKPDKTGAFVLRANVNQYEGEGADHRETNASEVELHEGGLHLRVPRLRWSSPGRKARRGVVKGMRRVRQGRSLMEDVPAIKRLGKIRGAILDTLDVAGGTATVDEVSDTLHRSRPRDLRRRVLPMLEDAGILTVDDDVVALTDNWLEALETARELGGEIEAEERDRERHRLQSTAYRNRHLVKTDEAPTEDEMRGRRESYAERRQRAIEVAIAELFKRRPEYRTRRAGQIVCALELPPDFPRGRDGWPKDAEVEEILQGLAA